MVQILLLLLGQTHWFVLVSFTKVEHVAVNGRVHGMRYGRGVDEPGHRSVARSIIITILLVCVVPGHEVWEIIVTVIVILVF